MIIKPGHSQEGCQFSIALINTACSSIAAGRHSLKWCAVRAAALPVVSVVARGGRKEKNREKRNRKQKKGKKTKERKKGKTSPANKAACISEQKGGTAERLKCNPKLKLQRIA
eukprot:scaffold14906_cov21-Tisochrysis_lutea.AAC.2